MRECKFCGYIGDTWGMTPKKKALVLYCPICGNVEFQREFYKRKDFEVFDEVLDFLNLNKILPEHIITLEQWALGFALVYYQE